MVVAVFLTHENELLLVPGHEGDGEEWLGVAVVVFAVDHSLAVAGDGVVDHQFDVGLVAVEFEDIDTLSVGAPLDIGEIAVGGVAGFQVDGGLAVQIVDPHGHEVACLTRHGIFVGLLGGNPG